ncbi:MAG: TrkH family potassium uptake protein [Solobacterium sp.]|nr:TrkH family potassium uptake protein [Solobacterium sp.]
MNLRMMLRIIAYILAVEAALMLPSVVISMALHEAASLHGFLLSIGIILAVSAFLFLITIKADGRRFYAREGLVTTGISWIVLGAMGCLPFYFSKSIPSSVDALFEMVSGFTTTGSSILNNVEILPKGILWWRSFSHWVGGMGVLVFLMAIVSLSGKNQGFTLHIMRSESPGPAVGKMVPRVKDTAKILYWIYTGLTVIDIALLKIGGLSMFDSCCLAFGTAGTGGFGLLNDSFASYSPYIQYVTTVFMLLFSVNFSIYYLLLLKKFKAAFLDEEFRLFWTLVFISITLIAINVRPLYTTMEETIRHTSFTVGTLMSTTGYATTDFDLWPSFAKSIVVLLMFFGACAGSTGGGFKTIRLLLLWKSLRRNIHTSLHPSEVRAITVNKRPIDEQILHNTHAYLVAYVIIVIISVLIVSLDGFSFETNFTAVMATLNNIGPGLAQVGPTCNFSGYSDLSKLVLTADMLAGRLEIYPMLILLSRSTWKRAR